MRRVVLFLLFAALCTGCRSNRRRERPKRDYTSANRASIEFLRETRRVSRAISRDSLRRTLDFKSRKDDLAYHRRASRRFLAESVFEGQWEEFRNSLRGADQEFRWPGTIRKNLRFGFLDTGK